jgi:hypothetical protein
VRASERSARPQQEPSAASTVAKVGTMQLYHCVKDVLQHRGHRGSEP